MAQHVGHNHDDTHNHYHNNQATPAVLEHHHAVWEELLCHFPYAIFSVAFAMICLSMMSYTQQGVLQAEVPYRLFHNFHFLHLLFAATGTVLTFRRYSKNLLLALVAGLLVPAFFCTLSDSFLPYFGGLLANLPIDAHWCFINHIGTVLVFLLVGVANGFAMGAHPTNHQLFYSVGFHFMHIFISSMASVLYLVSFGFGDWWDRMGFVFLFLLAVVLIPCTLSDIVVPILFSKMRWFGRASY